MDQFGAILNPPTRSSEQRTELMENLTEAN